MSSRTDAPAVTVTGDVTGANPLRVTVSRCSPTGTSPSSKAPSSAVVTVDPEGKEARGGGRVSVRDFGLQKATERLLAAWSAAHDAGVIHRWGEGVPTAVLGVPARYIHSHASLMPTSKPWPAASSLGISAIELLLVVRDESDHLAGFHGRRA